MADNDIVITASIQRVTRSEDICSIGASNSSREDSGEKLVGLNTSLVCSCISDPSCYDDLLHTSPEHFPDLNPLSEECVQRLNTLFSEHKIQHAAIVPSVADSVYVLGDDVESIKSEIETIFQAVTVKIVIRNNNAEESTPFTQLFSRVEKYVLESGEWQTEKKAYCEIAAVAQEMRRGSGKIRGTFSASLSKYCVVPAHLQRQSPSQTDSQTPTGTFKYTFYTESLPALTVLPTDISKYRIVDKEPGFFMNDIAFFKFVGLPANATAKPMSVLPIPTKAHIDLLARRQQVVVVGDAEGRVIFSPVYLGVSGEHLGLHLSFVITSSKSNSTQSLGEGDSGRLVSFKGRDNQLIPAGMVIGKFPHYIPEFNSSIYQAVILSEALKEIEAENGHLISDLNVLKIDE
ncbi:uncharacterized protein [Watersipora subatra]|uniref:uncharacterized protein n=1 Tax=Watersipora subatra TaxID=2589382 RepID=UPI00355AD176